MFHLYQECYAHSIVITNDGGWDRWGWLIYVTVWMEDRGWVSFYSFCFCLVLLYFVVWRSQSLYDGFSVCFFRFPFFLCLCSLLPGVTSTEKLLCLSCKSILKVSYLIIILWISLEKGECFDFNHSLGCFYPPLYIIRLLGWVCHFSLLICYSCSFYLHALMLLAFWEWKLPLFNDTGKD